MRFMNVPMYSTVRRMATLFVIWGEILFLSRRIPLDESMSVYLMIFGATVAGIGDFGFSFIGYLLCILNSLFTAAYLLYIPKVKDATKLDTFGLMYYNNLLSFPFMFIVVYLFEADAIYSPVWTDIGFLFCFISSSLQAFLLNYTIFLCSVVNSPLTTSVTGQIKTLLTTVIGLFIFGDVDITLLLIVGLTISSAASIYYSVVKYNQKLTEDALKAANKEKTFSV